MAIPIEIEVIGPVIDAVIAVTVMGWTIQTVSPFGWNRFNGSPIRRDEWLPSVDADQALEAINKASETGVTRWDVEWSAGDGLYEVTVKFDQGPNVTYTKRPTEAIALVEAALLITIELAA